jgi:hypothetical protein
MVDTAMVLGHPDAVLDRPGFMDNVTELGADWRDAPAFGPGRERLVALASA